MAAYYGHGEIMKVLAEAGANILNSNIHSGNNGLHLAALKNY